MKRVTLIFFLFLSFSFSNLEAQIFIYKNVYLSSVGNFIGKYVDSVTTYSYGAYAIGKQNPYAGSTSAVYRSYFLYDLSQIPINAIIDTVIVYYSTGPNSGYSFKITKMTTINPGSDATNFAAIGNSSVAHSGLTYGMNDFMSSSLKTHLQSVLPSRTLILGALSENETANDSYADLIIGLTVYYKMQAENLNFIAKNDLNGSGGVI